MKKSISINQMVYSAIFACLITVGAYLSLPMIPVPFTMQVMFVMMSGQIGGKKIGFYSVLIYILLGVMGVPVFSRGGGIQYFLSPTFGYILGFLFCSYIIGALLERKFNEISVKDRIVANFIGMFFIYLFGYFYYFMLTKTYLKTDFQAFNVFKNFVLIFIPKEILSSIFAALISDKIAKIVKKRVL